MVGMPRSGTTLTAELLALIRSAQSRRAQLDLKLSQRLPASGAPDRALLDALAAEYEAHAKLDDSGDAR
ncbi:MAG: hypothetical protein QM764_17760 [Chitinophagaceae bacterium]